VGSPCFTRKPTLLPTSLLLCLNILRLLETEHCLALCFFNESCKSFGRQVRYEIIPHFKRRNCVSSNQSLTGLNATVCRTVIRIKDNRIVVKRCVIFRGLIPHNKELDTRWIKHNITIQIVTVSAVSTTKEIIRLKIPNLTRLHPSLTTPTNIVEDGDHLFHILRQRGVSWKEVVREWCDVNSTSRVRPVTIRHHSQIGGFYNLCNLHSFIGIGDTVNIISIDIRQNIRNNIK